MRVRHEPEGLAEAGRGKKKKKKKSRFSDQG